MSNTTQDVPVHCRVCKMTYVLKLRPEGVLNWRSGMLIQDAMPELSAGDRELLISATCDPCFKKMFADLDE